MTGPGIFPSWIDSFFIRRRVGYALSGSAASLNESSLSQYIVLFL